MPRLLVNPGSSQQWEISLKPGTNTLGRSPACDAQIEHGSISGTHCQIVVNGETVIEYSEPLKSAMPIAAAAGD